MKVLILAFLMAVLEEDQFELINDHPEVKKLQEEGYEIVKVSDPVIIRAGHQQKLFVTVHMDHPDNDSIIKYTNAAAGLFKELMASQMEAEIPSGPNVGAYAQGPVTAEDPTPTAEETPKPKKTRGRPKSTTAKKTTEDKKG